MQVAKNLQHTPPYFFATINKQKQELLDAGVDVISLAIGDPDAPTPAHIVNAMKEALDNPENHHYPPYEGTREFRAAAAQYMQNRFGVEVDPETEVLALIGSKEGLAHLHTAFVSPGDYVLVPAVGYVTYSAGARLLGGRVYEMPMNEQNGWLADFTAVPPEVLAQAKMMFLSYPNNPTSAVAPPEYFDAAIAFCRENDLLLVHDNAYADITYGGYVAPSVLQRPGVRDVAIEFFSLSKGYNMTGWRIAFAAGNAGAISALATVKNNVDTGVFAAVQHAGAVALTGPQDCVAQACATYERRRNLAVETLNAIGLECSVPKATIYVWARVPQGYTSAAFAERMLHEAHVVVAPGSAYGASGEGFVRISLTCPDDRMVEAMRRIKETM